jgi:hypothetical protein
MPENIPDLTSNAGPEWRRSDDDWRDFLDYAGDFIVWAERAEKIFPASPNNPSAINAARISQINCAIEMLEKAKEDLCR